MKKEMKIYELILSLFYRMVRHDKRIVYYRKLRKNLSLSRAEIIKNQSKDLQKLINYAYNHTLYYKNLMDSLNIKPSDIRTKDDLSKLPTLTKKDIKENLDILKSDDHYGKNMTKIMSSGSTGDQGVIYRSNYFEQMSRGAWLRNNSMIGWYPTDKTVWIWTSPRKKSKISKRFFKRLSLMLNRKLVLNSFNYSLSDFKNWHKTMLSFKPKVIYGNSGVMAEFAEFLLDNNLKVPSVKLVISTTEKLRQRELMEKAFNCKVYDQYGSSEVIAIGIELEENEMVFTDDVVVCNRNEENEFLLTALHSYGFPLINYRIGDTGETKSIVEISSKYPFPIMNLTIGRTTDKFLNEENTKISTTSLGSYMAKFDLGIQQHKIIQADYKKFEIFYTVDNDINYNNYYQKVTNCLEEYFGSNLDIDFKKVTKIPKEKSGKTLMFKRTFKLEI